MRSEPIVLVILALKIGSDNPLVTFMDSIYASDVFEI